MKKLSLLFLISLIINLSAIAQITFDSKHFPIVGDVYTTYNVDTAGILPGTSGANQVWDFSNIKVGKTAKVMKFQDTSASKITRNYEPFNPSLCAWDSSEIYIFNKDSIGFYLVAIYDTTKKTEFVYVKQLQMMRAPMVYNDVFSSNFICDDSQNTNLFAMGNGTTELNADAYGTIKLPSGTYNDVIRVKQTMKSKFLNAAATDTISKSITTTYDWYDSKNKLPIFTIEITYTSIPALSIEKEIKISSAVMTNIEKIANKETVSIYPNPAKDIVNIIVNDNKSSLNIYNINGILVNKIDLKNTSNNINISDLPKGIYTFEVIGSATTFHKKIVVY